MSNSLKLWDEAVTEKPNRFYMDEVTSADAPMLRVDVLTIGITLAAILLLVGTATMWLQTLVNPDSILAEAQFAIISTLLLNIALILFGWRRFNDMNAALLESVESRAEALLLARFDPLTGLLNRRALADDFAEVSEKWRSEGHDIAAIVVDIDTFKSINDLFGHAGGDKVIEAAAIRISTVMPEHTLLARLGGDEFAALFPIALGDYDALDQLGERLVRELAEPVEIDGALASTSCSVGSTVSHQEIVGVDDLLRHADTAMYRAKRNGRRQYCRFDEAMQVALDRRDLIERELRLAIPAKQLYPVYEPLIDLTTGQAIGYEMLARWDSLALGEIGPSDFIPVAEQAGLISALSDRLFRQAMTDAVGWSPELILSINVSPLQLRDPWFAQKLLKLLTETGFPGNRLIVEITESAIVDNLPLAHAVFTSLRNQGISMALDDFGTGYSSIASLRALPFDSVKIDREYVARMAATSGGDTLAEAVLQLGRSLGLPVVAEGIETSAAAQRLSDLDCALGQGHFYGRSLSNADVLARHAPDDADATKLRMAG